MQQKKWMLYGATGYTGRLICEEAKAMGLFPVLAGRSAEKLSALAQQYGWEYRVFDLQSVTVITQYIQDIAVVLHAAGPFSHTAAPMVEACLQCKTHYLDITGEIEVFERIAKRNKEAVEAGIMLMPGTGFDVVPTDCMAAILKEHLPDAHELTLAFSNFGGQLSHGTASTMVQNLGKSGVSRKGGILIPEPIGRHSFRQFFGSKEIFFMSIPWGDVSTAWYTTGIPNIRTYTRTKPLTYKLLKWQAIFNPLLRTGWFKQYMQRKIDNAPAGPDAEKRKNAYSLIFGKAVNPAGKIIAASFTCPDGYTLTAQSSVHIVQQVLSDGYKPGFQTPASCYGSKLIFALTGVKPLEWIT